MLHCCNTTPHAWQDGIHAYVKDSFRGTVQQVDALPPTHKRVEQGDKSVFEPGYRGPYYVVT